MHFDKKKLLSLGIDEPKSDLIEFLIKHESLDQFDENDAFYYWFSRKENALKDSFEFINKNKDEEYIYTKEGKDFNLNSFEGIAQFVIHTKKFETVNNFFNSNLSFFKREYFLRYSKKYKKLEYFFWNHDIGVSKKRVNCFVNHKKYKFFQINEKNFVIFYINNKMPRYVSNKNAPFLRPFVSYNFNYYNSIDYSSMENFVFALNRKLLSIHQKSKIFNDKNFLKITTCLHNIPNKLMMNTSNLDEVLSRVTKNRHVPKILTDKFEKQELIYLYNVVEYDQVDKIIKFLYEHIDVYNKKETKTTGGQYNNMNLILRDYFYVKLGLKKIDTISLDEPICASDLFIVDDYIRICVSNQKKLNLKINSFKRLVSEHDNYVKKITLKQIPELKVNRKFPKIKSTENFDIEKITDKIRLFNESEIQKHCVKTYAGVINTGKCCIYSFLDKATGLRWTLEVRRITDQNKNNFFYLNQLKGRFNSNPPESVSYKIIQILKFYGIEKDQSKLIKLNQSNVNKINQEQHNNVIRLNLNDDDLNLNDENLYFPDFLPF